MLAGAQQLARAPQFQIGLGDLEAVVGAHQRLQALVRLRHQETPALGRATSYPAPQLMQLGQTVAIRVLDDHDGGVWHVHAYLDDRGGDQDLQLSRGEIRQRRLFFGGGLGAVGQPHGKICEGLSL